MRSLVVVYGHRMRCGYVAILLVAVALGVTGCSSGSESATTSTASASNVVPTASYSYEPKATGPAAFLEELRAKDTFFKSVTDADLVSAGESLCVAQTGSPAYDAVRKRWGDGRAETFADVFVSTYTCTGTPPATASTAVAPSDQRPAGYVSEATWTDGLWPFTVPEGMLQCGSLQRVTFTTNRVIYALNGAAKSAGGFEDVDSIWRDDLAYAGVKVNLGPMIQRGLTLCP